MTTAAFTDAQAELRRQASENFPFTHRELRNALAKQHYYLDEYTCRKLVNYASVGKPVGLRGEPGVGKSELPEQLAALLNAKFIDIECHSQLEAMDIGVSWNGFKQIVDAQTDRLNGEPFSLNYLNATPLIASLRSNEPVVLRIDEVDKLNENTSNFFLRFLDKRELVIHDLASDDNVLKSHAPIYVFLTSNDYRELDPAIMRRIAWLDLSFPPERILAQIVQQKTGIPIAMAQRVAYMTSKVRQLELKKKPSIGEVLDWTRALILETDGRLTLDAIQVTLGLLLKHAEDERKGWQEIRSWVE